MDNSVLDDLAAVVGYTPTRKLAIVYAGRRMGVPREDRGGDHPIARLIGAPAFRALVREFGGEFLFIPKSGEDDRYRRDLMVARALASGHKPAHVAERWGISRRRVEQIAEDLQARGWVAPDAGGRGRAPRYWRPSAPRLRLALEILGTGEESAEPPGGAAGTAAE